MRHRKKRVLELSTGIQKQQNVLRTLLTNLVTYGQMQTTIKRSKAVKAYADTFFARLVKLQGAYEGSAAQRECIRYIKAHIYTDKAGKKIMQDILPRYVEEAKTSGFVTNVKLGPRPGDAAEKVLVRLI